jgi:hypothetical protein
MQGRRVGDECISRDGGRNEPSIMGLCIGILVAEGRQHFCRSGSELGNIPAQAARMCSGLLLLKTTPLWQLLMLQTAEMSPYTPAGSSAKKHVDPLISPFQAPCGRDAHEVSVNALLFYVLSCYYYDYCYYHYYYYYYYYYY